MRFKRAHRAFAVVWRTAFAVLGALGLAAALATIGLGFGGNAAEHITKDTGSGAALGLALVPTLALVLATVVGMTCGVSVVAVLVRDAFAGQRPRLLSAWVRAWAVLPRLVVVALVATVLFAVSLVGWSVVTVAVLVRAGWRLRSPQTRASARNELWLAVPGAAAVAVLAAVPAAWSALLSKTSLVAVGRDALRAPLLARVKSLAGLLVLAGASYGLGVAGIAISKKAASSDPTTFAWGTAGLGLCTAALIVVAGVLLGLLARSRGDAPTPPARPAGDSSTVPFRSGGPRFWGPARVSMAAALLSGVVVLPTVMTGAVYAPASATTAPSSGDIVVNTLEDTGTPVDGECDTAPVCGVRAALARAQTMTVGNHPVLVTFDVSGTIVLSDTLRLPVGVTLDGAGNDVTLDAHHDFRALFAHTTQEGGGPRAFIHDLTVVGGRSAAGGAGLFADNVAITLDKVEFSDNVSDPDGPGGAGMPDGGAVWVNNLTVTDSLFVDNHAHAGVGGAVAANRLQWTNSTSVNNTGGPGLPEGGAIYVAVSGTVNHATVIDGGGIGGSEWGATLAVSNSAVSPSVGAFPCARITDPTDPSSPSVGNVDPTGTCLGKTASLAPVGPLADNGGPTRTVALMPGSAAIAAADAGMCAPLDQRGHVRPAQSCDAGAFQYGDGDIAPVAVTVTTINEKVRPGESATVNVKLTSPEPIPDGTVTLRLDGDVLADELVPNSYGEVTHSTGALAQGQHHVRAVFVPADGSATFTSPAKTIGALGATTMVVAAQGPASIGSPATIHATLSAPGDGAGVPAPTGDVVFTSGSVTYTAHLDASGVATWEPARLPRSEVQARWEGDDFHDVAAGFARVSTSDVATTTTVTVDPNTVTYGEEVPLSARIVDSFGDPVTGWAHLVVDGERMGEQRIGADGTVEFLAQQIGPRSYLPGGTHTVGVETVPDDGWATSSDSVTVTVNPRASHVELAVPETVTYLDTIAATATVSGLGAATVEILDNGTVVDSHDVTLVAGVEQDVEFTIGDWRHAQVIPDVGVHHITARIVASASIAASSQTVDVTVEKAATTLSLSQTPWGQLGEQRDLDVIIGNALTAAHGTLILRDGDGAELDHLAVGEVVRGGIHFGYGGTLHWTPTKAHTDLHVTFVADEDGNYLGSTGSTALDVERKQALYQHIDWSSVTAGAGALDVDFTAPDTGTGTPAVTGVVTVEDTQLGNMVVGTAAVVDGHAWVNVRLTAGRCYCNGRLRLVYSGDDWYRPGPPVSLANVDVPGHQTTLTFDDLPASIPFNGAPRELRLNSTVHAPVTPAGTVVYTVNGIDLPAVPVGTDGTAHATYAIDPPAGQQSATVKQSAEKRAGQKLTPAQQWSAQASAGVAALLVSPFAAGGTELRVSARYIPASGQWLASSTAVESVRLLDAPAPVLTITADGPLTVATSTTVTVATPTGDFVDRDVPVVVFDSFGNTLGTGTWGTGHGYITARVTIVPKRGGPQNLTASFSYGQGVSGTSEPLAVTVAGTRTDLTLTATGDGPRQVGFPLGMRVDVATRTNPNQMHGSMRVTLYEDGVTVDEYNLAPGQASHLFTVAPHHRHSTVFTVQTTGDGADFGAGTAQTAVDVAGVNTTITAQGPERVARSVAVKVDMALAVHSPGQPAPTGVLTATVRAEGVTHQCTVALPATSCSFAADALPAGKFGIDVSYTGDMIHEPAQATDAVRVEVYTTSSDLSVSYSPDPQTWLVGQEVTATWTATDPLTPTGPTGSVNIVRQDWFPETGFTNEKVLCSRPAATGSCTFKVPGSPLALDKQQNRYLRSTYTPATVSTKSSDSELGYPSPRCLSVRTHLESVYYKATRNQPNPTLEGTTCSVPGVTGFIEGTEVTATSTATWPEHYKITEWHVNAAGKDDVEAPNWALSTPTQRIFDVKDDTVVYPVIDWKPQCVTLHVEDEAGHDPAYFAEMGLKEGDPSIYAPGHLDILTAPNCANPTGIGPSQAEKADLLRGRGHFAVGTVVDVEPVVFKPETVTVITPERVSLGVPGADPATAEHPHPHVTMTQPTTLYGKFRASPRMCTPVQLYAGVGGKVEFLSSAIPHNDDVGGHSYWFEDLQGRCLTAAGERGFLAGSTVKMRATPGDATETMGSKFFSKWLDGPDLAEPATRAESLKLSIEGDPPYASPWRCSDQCTKWFREYDPYRPQERTVTVPLRPIDGTWQSPVGAPFGVKFGTIQCVKVTMHVKVPLPGQYGYRTTTADPGFPASNCSAAADPANDIGWFNERDWGERAGQTPQWVRNDSYTYYYLTGTEVTLSGAEHMEGVRGELDANWTVSTENPNAAAGQTADPVRSKGESVKFTVAYRHPVSVDLSYAPSSCRVPNVKIYPAGIDRTYSVMTPGQCPPGQYDPSKPVMLGSSGWKDPRIKAVWEVYTDQDQVDENQIGRVKDTRHPVVKSDQLTFHDQANYAVRVNLHYCAPLNVDVDMVDRNGAQLGFFNRDTGKPVVGQSSGQNVVYGPNPEDILTDGDDCPLPLMVYPGTTAQVGASGKNSNAWTVVGFKMGGQPVTGVPSQKVNVDGTVDTKLTAVVTPRCVTLNAGSKVDVLTGPNCPGAAPSSRLYLGGTVVKMQFGGGARDKLGSWSGVDASDDGAAVVVMNRDRSVSVDYHHMGDLELVTNILTNLTQRAVSALVTAATGAATAFLFVAQVGALAVVGIAEGLEALGVHGAAIDTMRNAAETVQAGIDVTQSLSNCTSEWATGGGAPPLSPSTYQGGQGVSVGAGLGDELVGLSENSRLEDAFGSAASAYDMMNLFGSGFEAYLRDAGDSWASIVDIGGCVRDSGLAAGDAATRLVGRVADPGPRPKLPGTDLLRVGAGQLRCRQQALDGACSCVTG